jgi:predicted DsbA family dithiol-disulfide isomerase
MNAGGSMMKKKVIVYSDYICPFCFIGKHRMDRLQEELDVEIEWRGLEIHPETPPEGQTLEDMGLNPHYIDMVIENVNKLAAEIELELKSPPKISNSKRALVLAEYAKENGKFYEYHCEVFKTYWQDQKDIGNIDVLSDIVDQIGLDSKEAQNYLEEERAKEKIKRFHLEARSLGIDGVPTFVIGTIIIEGAQPYEVIKEAIEKESC